MRAAGVVASRRIESEDGTLVGAVLAGDTTAEAALVQLHRDRLVNFCYRRTHDADLAEDLAQETLFRVFERLESFDRRRAMWPLLKHIAANLATDHDRKRSRETVGLPPAAAGIEAQEDPVASVDERCDIEMALSHVPTRQSAALQLRYLEDWSSAETAEFFDTNCGTVKQLLHRARASFKVAYEEAGTHVAGGFALPFGARFRDLVGRLRTRVVEWEASLGSAASCLTAATAGIAAAAALTTTGFFPDAKPSHQPIIDLPTYALVSQPIAPESGRTAVTALPDAADRAAAGSATGEVVEAPAQGPQRIHSVSLTAPDGAVLGDPTDADADLERDEDTRSLSYEFERRLPEGHGLQDDADVATIHCDDDLGAVSCAAVDELPEGS